MKLTEAGRKLGKTIRLLRQPQWRAALLTTRTAAAIEHAEVLAGLGLATVIDVGANRGQFSLLVRSLYPSSEIHAFEPLPDARSTLEELFAGDRRLHVHPIALGREPGRAVLHVTRDLDSSSLLAPLPAQALHFPGTEEARELSVEVERLDAVLGASPLTAPVLLKLDVQGHELEVLQGAEGLLPQVDLVYAEVSFEALYRGQALAADVIRHLVDRGFDLTTIGSIQRSHTAGRILQADLLFSRRPSRPVAR